jgi:DNA transformation protein
MAKDASFVEFVIDQLRRLPEVRARRMFGAHGVYSGEHFFAVVDEGRVYFKTDEKTRARYTAAGMKPFEYAPGKLLKTYYEVPVDTIEDDDLLTEWASEAVDVAKASPPKKKR